MYFFVLCVYKAFPLSLILFRAKVRFRVSAKARVMVLVVARITFRVRNLGLGLY